MPSPIDLAALQDRAAPHFWDWDQAVAADDTNMANEAREAIMDLGRKAVAELAEVETSVGGLYIFANCRRPGGRENLIRYVGLAKKRKLSTRVADYSRKELSVLDASLLELEREAARARIRARIAVAMPTSEKKWDSYTRTHMKSRMLSAADTIFLFPGARPASEIEDAEAVLIVAALQGGQNLVNIQKRDKVPTLEGRDMALAALEKWHGDGLDEQMCDDLASKISTMT